MLAMQESEGLIYALLGGRCYICLKMKDEDDVSTLLDSVQMTHATATVTHQKWLCVSPGTVKEDTTPTVASMLPLL